MGRDRTTGQLGKSISKSRKLYVAKPKCLKTSITDENPVEAFFSVKSSFIESSDKADSDPDVDDLISEEADPVNTFPAMPKRGEIDPSLASEELDELEKRNFIDWRRKLSKFEEQSTCVLTPYEKNLELWRQLWRVVERSDVIVQIVDARNPLLYYSPDLEVYVKEVDLAKTSVVLLNKADFLSDKQRLLWAIYFDSRKVRVIFFSALQSSETNQKRETTTKLDDNINTVTPEISSEEYQKEESTLHDTLDHEDHSYDNNEKQLDSDDNAMDVDRSSTEPDSLPPDNTIEYAEEIEKDGSENNCTEFEKHSDGFESNSKATMLDKQSCAIKTDSTLHGHSDNDEARARGSLKHSLNNFRPNSHDVLTVDELIEVLKHSVEPCIIPCDKCTIGLIGYPNVGKSSTLNVLCQSKKVAVSATPGKTKHFQTIQISENITLCDCPGLVFPSLVSSRADMVLGSVLPIDQIHDYMTPMSELCQTLPNSLFESVYHIDLSSQASRVRQPTAEERAAEILDAYAVSHGIMSTGRGLPNLSSAAKCILKDVVKGKILYTTAPPNIDSDLYQSYSLQTLSSACDSGSTSNLKNHSRSGDIHLDLFDRRFFKQPEAGFHIGKKDRLSSDLEKPWKKHHNSKKKEKLRRVYRHLDV